MKKGRKKREYRKNLINDLEKLLKEVKSASEVKRIQCIYFKVKFNFLTNKIQYCTSMRKTHLDARNYKHIAENKLLSIIIIISLHSFFNVQKTGV